MKTCQREGCNNPVVRAVHKYCSPACGQRASQKEDGGDVAYRFASHGDKATVDKVVPERVLTLEQLEQVCEVDLREWQVVNWTCEVRDTAKGDQHFHVKAWLRRKNALISARAEADDIKRQAIADLRNIRGAAFTIPRRKKDRVRPAEHMLEIGIYDAHFGKLAWGKETGHQNYDLKIAERDFQNALETIIDRTRSFDFEHIVLVVGNDLFTADSPANLTTMGTPQDVDGRFHKSFCLVRQLITNSILRLRTIAPVLVPMVPGNHDRNSVWHLGDSLECYFHDVEGVRIMNEPTPRKYHQYYQNMLMWTHGDKGKRANYPLVMASEQPSIWGATTHRECHVGHLHQTIVDEYPGVHVRTLRALCPPDNWHAERGFIGQKRGAEAFVWHRTEGIISTALYSVPSQVAEAA